MPKINEETKQERKSLITAHAFKIFSEKGYSQATVDDIVSSSGVSKGGIYTYFKSKEEIFLAIAEERLNNRKELIKTFSTDMTCKEKVTKYIKWILEWIIDEKNMLQLKFTFEFWSVTSRNDTIKNFATERYNQVSRDLYKILEEGVHRGEFKSTLDIESTCYIILSSTDSIGFYTGIMGLKANTNILNNLINMILNDICGVE
jgi:AcrR family transcriptional regulator